MNPIQSAIATMDRNTRRSYIRQYGQQCMKFPEKMQELDLPEDMRSRVLGNWRSNRFLAVAWLEHSNPLLICRLSVNRVEIDETGSWLAGISWDDLFRIKNECGFDNNDAIEVYPALDKLVNVANMRHLWILKDRLTFDLGVPS